MPARSHARLWPGIFAPKEYLPYNRLMHSRPCFRRQDCNCHRRQSRHRARRCPSLRSRHARRLSRPVGVTALGMARDQIGNEGGAADMIPLDLRHPGQHGNGWPNSPWTGRMERSGMQRQLLGAASLEQAAPTTKLDQEGFALKFFGAVRLTPRRLGPSPEEQGLGAVHLGHWRPPRLAPSSRFGGSVNAALLLPLTRVACRDGPPDGIAHKHDQIPAPFARNGFKRASKNSRGRTASTRDRRGNSSAVRGSPGSVSRRM